MIRAVILAAFVAGMCCQTCVPPVITHQETGDDLYRVLLADLAIAQQKGADISASAQGANGCTQFQNVDFFTQLLVTITADNAWLASLIAGTGTPTGDECVGVNLRIDFDLMNTQGKASTPVPGTDCNALNGSALAQYTLQRLGLTLIALAGAPAGPTPPGKWQKYVQDVKDGIAAARQIIATNDAANCVATTRTLANALKGIREAGSTVITPPTTPGYSG